MLLVTAATSFEMEAFATVCPASGGWSPLITGIGPVETAMHLTAVLACPTVSFRAIVNFGVAGAYCREAGGAALLDICLAEREILGDLGVCYGEMTEPLRGEGLTIHDAFELDSDLLAQAATALTSAKVPFHRGTFVTVSCVSGSRRRGTMLARQHQALCENMEGAAAARVCQRFSLPLLELRCISNLVEDRNLQQWRLRDACVRCGEVAALVIKGLQHD
ncbi:futalosine nucleosidase [Desulfobulbus propionicus DSM 2032]|jgi:futalosine hydrolase|uniref:Futalosine hydrolase n=1 Tax=Desulfobulbus propionicus (strain ATCC 33891 / DSM 2032 / VKM B-1956 / 1pr3) TaxID=577650 RepID=A0A7U3YP15_DESPD|nr:futalosine hydrolase [Desulfobulbus propionicus]ADW18914.1 futalosine nucleosidase [Desulfobulbus propionicus DSM 2032]